MPHPENDPKSSLRPQHPAVRKAPSRSIQTHLRAAASTLAPKTTTNHRTVGSEKLDLDALMGGNRTFAAGAKFTVNSVEIEPLEPMAHFGQWEKLNHSCNRWAVALNCSQK